MTSEPRVVVVGTGRSGTGFLASVLNRCNVAAGHEDWWNPTGRCHPNLDVDVSWCAIAQGLDEYTGRVFCQVRNPIDTWTSLALRPPHDEYRALYVRVMGEDPIDPFDWAALATVTMLEKSIGRAERTWALERITAHDVHRVIKATGRTVPHMTINTSLRATRTDVNSHWGGDRLALEELPSRELRARLAGVATAFLAL